MWVSLIVLCVLLLCAVGVISLVARRSFSEGFVESYVDSVKAYRADRLGTKEFDVEHRDVSLNDVFSTFTPFDGEAYVTPDELNAAVSDIATAPGAAQVKRVADLLKKEHHAA